ncbi:PAS domain S-box protein [Coraliomargarita sp. SDUM461003]|uniref:histidine kinase n=1 Tax=Thalassobacterium maritimum TaxID=3041265 RepID=A0ABU1AQJ5_9BACT|nr:PAS domain S-box protein [Coraliomargarita sp. SDUM461003]MDQ8206434.1 PAS domain S-box protein [Coraliomargarita sp. SDUM461003]
MPQSIPVKITTLLLLFLAVASTQLTGASKRILYLSSYHSEFTSASSHLKAISRLHEQTGREIDLIYMDTKRHPVAERFPITLQQIQEKIHQHGSYDVIVSSDDNALKFLLLHKDGLLGSSPVIFFGINDRNLGETAAQRADFCGILEQEALNENAELALQLFPSLGTLHVITDPTPSGQAQLESLLKNLSPEIEERLEVDDLSNYTFSEYKERLRAYPHNDVLLLLSAYKDKTGAQRSFLDLALWFKNHTRLPIIYPYSHGIGLGFLGGKVVSHQQMAQLAVNIANDYLNGKPLPEDHLIENYGSNYIFDYREMQCQQLSVTALPPGAIVLDQPQSLYGKHRVYFITAFIIALLLAGFGIIIGIIHLKQRKLLMHLKESEGQTAGLFKNSATPILLIGPKTGKILDANPAAIDYYGYSQSELTEINLSDIDNGAFDAIGNVLERVTAGERKSYQFTHRLSNGEARTVDVLFISIQSHEEPVLFSIIQDTTERRHMQESLAAEQIRLANILTGTHVGTWEWNVATGELRLNQYWAEMAGYQLKDLAPIRLQTWINLCHPEDLKIAQERIQDHFEGRTDYYSCELRMRHKNGTWVWITDRGKLATRKQDGSPEWMYGTHQDITEIKKSEEVLRRNLGFITSLFDSIPDMIFYKDLDGKYLGCNAKFAKIVGSTPEAIRGKTDYELFEPKLANYFRENDKQMLAQGSPRQNKEWIRDEGGNKILLSMLKAPYQTADGDILGLLGVGRDITQHYHDEQQLRLQALVLEQIQDCVTVMNLNGIITYVNDAETQTLGFDRSQLIGSDVLDYGTTCNACRPGQDFLALTLQNESWQGELTKCTADGTQKQFISKMRLVRNENGEVVAISRVSTDITERKKYESKLIEAKEAAEAASRAKNTFLATMSHELRTPLNPIIGLTDLLLESKELANKQRQWLQIIKARSNHLLQLIEDILDISRIESGRLTIATKACSIPDLLDEIGNTLGQPCSQKGLSLNFQIAPQLSTPCKIDPARTQQILLNLVNNAIKFSESGEIKVIADIEMYQASKHLPRANLHLIVRDQGPGIPVEEQSRIFQEFQQIDSSSSREHEGVGLGLAICKRLVELMSGKIWINSDYQQGAEFHVKIPVTLEYENKQDV